MLLRIKAERRRLGMSQTELGALARLSASDVSRIESGRFRPYPKQATRLADALNLPVDELLRPVEAKTF